MRCSLPPGAARGGRRAARQAADSARQQASDLFLSLDETVRSVRLLVEAYAGLHPGSASRSLSQELAHLIGAADTASSDWIEASDRHAPALETEDIDVSALREAELSFRRAADALVGARDALVAFQGRHPDLEGRVRTAWARVAPEVAAAGSALADAQRAAAGVTASGIHSERLQALLEHAEALGRPVAEGPHRHGVAATLEQAPRAVAAARDVVVFADQLRDLASRGRSRLRSTATRLDGVAGRLELVPGILSRLRREFAARCSIDLDGTPRVAAAALDQARQRLHEAEAHADRGAWEAAGASLTAARDQVAVAESAVDAVVDRARDLEAVRADPGEELSRTRFALRDAQRLVVAAGGRVSGNETTILDNLVVRLEHVDQRLEGPHPDYWGYLSELRAVREVTAAVVRRTRAAMAAPTPSA